MSTIEIMIRKLECSISLFHFSHIIADDLNARLDHQEDAIQNGGLLAKMFARMKRSVYQRLLTKVEDVAGDLANTAAFYSTELLQLGVVDWRWENICVISPLLDPAIHEEIERKGVGA
ncbi:hypothetical protein CAPTEDRAFT_205612 [Capitella teleta]|uniref:Uncharacterized protein n=1 Tax=Capitella teleta TaxID=283909 RepID=R7UL36_CAPTE|nr:hypothetical protein CAPTEDRAFT_205612 [Capitella teleta]|eukprot:ELU06823.1 hypothetical protein CAPTEDRAFT_205612 [Capitella teleta]